jgi:hypothetical protein
MGKAEGMAHGEEVKGLSAKPDEAGNEAIRTSLSRSIDDLDGIELSLSVDGW